MAPRFAQPANPREKTPGFPVLIRDHRGETAACLCQVPIPGTVPIQYQKPTQYNIVPINLPGSISTSILYCIFSSPPSSIVRNLFWFRDGPLESTTSKYRDVLYYITKYTVNINYTHTYIYNSSIIYHTYYERYNRFPMYCTLLQITVCIIHCIL